MKYKYISSKNNILYEDSVLNCIKCVSPERYSFLENRSAFYAIFFKEKQYSLIILIYIVQTPAARVRKIY